MEIVIREATPADQSIIADFNSRLAEETENMTLDQERIGAGVNAVLTDSGKGRYWLAMVHGEVVGQIMVTYEWSDWRNGMFWWIQSVYVAEKFRRKGIFAAMYEHVKSMVQSDPGACGIRLYVEKHNRRAQDTYRNHGLRETGHQVMESLLPSK